MNIIVLKFFSCNFFKFYFSYWVTKKNYLGSIGFAVLTFFIDTNRQAKCLLDTNWQKNRQAKCLLDTNWQTNRQAKCLLNTNWQTNRQAKRLLDTNWQTNRQAKCLLDTNWQTNRQAKCLLDTNHGRRTDKPNVYYTLR